MIDISPDSWLVGPTIVAIAIATATASSLLTRRWGWKVLPLVALAGLIVPAVVIAIVMGVLQFATHYGETVGYVFAVDERVLILGLSSAAAGFVATLGLRRIQVKGR